MRKGILFTAALALSALAPAAFAQSAAGWTVEGQASGAAATATKAANANRQFVLFSVSASCATTPAAPILLQIKDGTTVIWEAYLTAGQSWTFGQPGIAITPGAAASAVLASCGGSVAGKVNLGGQSQ